MAAVNKAILLGNLGRDMEMRFTQSGTPVGTFSLATTEKYTDRDGQKREDTQWHRVTVWGKTAEAIHEYMTKGKQVYVEGKLQTKEWEGKDGKKQKSTEIRADRVVLLGGGGGERSGGSRSSGGSRRQSQDRDINDDMPADGYQTQEPVSAPSDDDIPF